MSKPTVAVIVRFWNAEDLVDEWMQTVFAWADYVLVMDAGSYHCRSTASARLPGAIIDDLKLTL